MFGQHAITMKLYIKGHQWCWF